jgi:hypothetical protein
MEYFIGSLSTFLTLLFCIRFFLNDKDFKAKPNRFKYIQSHIYEIVKPLLPDIEFVKKKPNRQSSKHEDSTNVKVIILENKAYWIKDNLFYAAEMNNNKIDPDSTKVLDIMSMDKVQLDKMLFIVDRLRDGK